MIRFLSPTMLLATTTLIVCSAVAEASTSRVVTARPQIGIAVPQTVTAPNQSRLIVACKMRWTPTGWSCH